MSLSEAVHKALGALPGPSGALTVEADGQRAEIDVIDHDRLGVRIRAVRIVHPDPCDVVAEAERLAKHRGLPEPVAPIEVDRRLGGAILRGEPDAQEFTEVHVRPETTEWRRWRAAPGEPREPAEIELSRKQLGRLIDGLTARPATP